MVASLAKGKLHVLTTTSHNWAVVHYRCEDAERSGASMNFEKLHGSEVDPVVF